MKLKIKVTQKMIDSGQPGSNEYCPIALAIFDKLKTIKYNFHKVKVKKDRVYIDYVFYELPEIVRNFIRFFDHNDEIEPFEFELTIF